MTQEQKINRQALIAKAQNKINNERKMARVMCYKEKRRKLEEAGLL